jgi:hypothetical protein
MQPEAIRSALQLSAELRRAEARVEAGLAGRFPAG